MQINVVRNAKKNIFAGAFNKIIILLCPFVERTFIEIYLGSQYLGLSSLYSSILSVLSLAELGFNTAMVYNMYKPVAEQNVKQVNALLNFYRKVYRVIGCVIISIGLLLIPFLPNLIKGSYPSDINLVKLYLIYLINAALGYFLFAYMTSILVAHQRNDIESFVNSFVKIALAASQIAILVIFKNYYLFVLLMPIFTAVNNLWVAWRVHKTFPQYKPEGQLKTDDISSIKKLVAGTFIQRACSVTRNSLDSICISAFLGLTMTAIYNNYFMIMNGITTFVSLISAAFLGGVGNHVATRSVKENFDELKKLDFMYLWIGGWCTICLLCLFQPFMEIWMGKDMLLPFPAVILICIYFNLLKLGDMRSMYSSAKGLWWEHRFRSISETIMNLVLNLVLGKLFGVYGIIMATMISLFLCNYIWATSITFRKYFSKDRIKEYYKYQGKQEIITAITAVLTLGLCNLVKLDNQLLSLLTRMIICVIFPNVLFFLVFHKTKEFNYVKKKIFNR